MCAVESGSGKVGDFHTHVHIYCFPSHCTVCESPLFSNPHIHVHTHTCTLQCGPCRGFTPQLVKSYKKLKDEGKSFEIIFVTSDRDQGSMSEYLSEMPWWAIPYSDKRCKALSRSFDISGLSRHIEEIHTHISSLLRLITNQGRRKVF